MALNFNWLKTKKLEDIYKVEPVNTQQYLKPPAPVMRPLQAPAQQRPQVMPTVAFTPTPITLNTFNKLPTSPQNTINNILRVSPNAVIPQKKNNWAEDWYNKTQLKKAITDIPDIFDANSASDRQKRLQAGQPELYADQQRNLYKTTRGKEGSLRPYQNLGAGIAGQTARYINTGAAAGRETDSTIKVGILQALGLNKEANALMDANTLAQQRDYQWNSGLLGQGTIFNNPEEYGNLSALELSKRIGATTVGAGLEIIPFTKGAGIGATAFYKGLSPAKQILARSVLGASENAIQDVAEQQLTNPSGWRPQQTALAAGLGTLMPNVGPVLGGAKNLARYPANKAALDLVNQQNTIKQTIKQLDELNQAKPKVVFKEAPQVGKEDLFEALKAEARKYKSAEEFVNNKLVLTKKIDNPAYKGDLIPSEKAKLEKLELESIRSHLKKGADEAPIFFRSSSLEDMTNTKNNGIFFSNSLSFGRDYVGDSATSIGAKKAKVYVTELDIKKPLYITKDEIEANSAGNLQEIIKEAKANGYDALVEKYPPKDIDYEQAINPDYPAEVAVFDKSQVRTIAVLNKDKGRYTSQESLYKQLESQLTDIYNQATQSQPPKSPQVGKISKDGLQPIDAAYSVKTKADIIPEQAKMIAQQSGASVSDVERNIRKFGFDATNNTYSQLRDSMGYDSVTKKGIKSIDAVATAKLNKSAPQVGKTPFQNKTEIDQINRILENKDTVGTGQKIADYYRTAKGEDWQVVKMSPDEYLNRAAKAMGQDPATWKTKPMGNVDKYAQDMTKGDKFPMPWINEVAGSQEGRTRALAAKQLGVKEIDVAVATKPKVSAPQVGKPVVTAKPTVTIKKQLDGSSYYLPKEKLPVLNSEGKPAPLGTIVDTFYKSKKGNKEIDFNTLEKLGKTVADSARRNLNAIGSNYEDVMLKIHQGLADGKKTLLDAGLTPAETKIRLAELSELNYARYKRALGRGGVGEGDFGEMYVPNQRIGQYKGEGTLFEGYRSSKPGNEYIRQNEIPIAERDLTPDVTAEYIPRYGDNKLYQTERIARAVKKVNPETTEESVKNAASRIIDLQRRTNELENSIGLGGLGRKRTRTASEGLRVETATELSDIGKSLGKEQTVIDETPRGWTNGDRINSVKTPTGEVLGDYIGLNQHREARSFANSQTQNAAGDRAVLAASVKERLMTAYNIPEESATYISESIGRIKKDIPQAIVQGKVERSYKMAAKQQIMENLQTLDIKNNKLNTDITDLTNQILTEGYIENTTSTKVVGGILKGTNAIFRKLNLGSALNELSDLTGLVTVYGKKTNLLKPNFSLIEKYGLGDIDPALAPYIKATQRGDSLKSILASIDTKTNLYRYVETYKSAVLASTAEKFHKNLSGDALTEQILLDYRNLVLPVDEFTKTFADSAPLYTQYMSWGIRNLQKEFRLAGGKLDTGIMKDKNRLERVARNAYANLPAKTVFWLASNALKGTPILTAFGINDYLGVTQKNFSGIEEKDESLIDKYGPLVAGNSPTLSLLFSVYQSYEKEQMKNDPNYEGLNPYKDNNFARQSTSVFTPQAVKNAYGVPEIKDGQLVFSGGADDLMRQGYSTNAAGKIQYAAPTDPYNTAKAYVFGKGSTQKAREYSGKTNIIDRMKMGQTTNPVDFVTNFARSVDDMAKEQTNIRDTNYNYPVSDRYQDLINAGANVQETIDKSRATQKIDKEYYNSPEGKAYKEANATVWNSDTKKYESNLITPEKWKIINAEKSGKTFERNKQSAQNRNRDFGDPIDPIYSNKWSSRAKEVMDMRMQNTGDDTEMKDIAYATKPWYKEYMKDYIAYINAQKNRVYGENSDFGPSNRVKEYQELTINNPAIPTNSEKNYPLINQYMTIKNGNDRGVAANPELAKDFYKANATQLSADFDKQKIEKFIWTNKMRQLEGASPIEWGTFQNVTFGYEDDERKVFNELKYGKGFGGFGGDKTAGSAYKYNLSRGSKVGAVKFKKFSQSAKPLTFKKKNYSMPKVTMKKSKV